MDQKKKKLSLNKETVRSLDDQELKSVAGGTSFFGCGLTVPCTFWQTCGGCTTEARGCYLAEFDTAMRMDDVFQRTLEDLGRT